jgi:hypothetical protein
MTLPFRRRHHDDEAAHDRARALWSIAMLEPLDARDSAWLETHLAGCAECRLEHEAYLADRELLLSLRERQPEPPRDLWARTSAAIEQEAARHRRGRAGIPLADRLVPRRQRLPLGALSGLLVAIVVFAVSVAPQSILPPSGPTAAGSAVAVSSPHPVPSQLSVKTATIGWVETGTNGSYQLLLADVDEVCPDEKSGCAPIHNSRQTALTLGARPEALVGSPANDQIVVVSGSGGSQPGSVIVVPVPTPAAGGSGGPSPAPSAGASSGTSLPPASPASTSKPPASSGPTGGAGPTPLPTQAGAHSIAEGVVVVGETRYSPDGRWLAFSAAPIDGRHGPDLYVWNGTDPSAVAVTSDHATYFSSWLGDRILASRIPAAAGAPLATKGPAASAAASPAAGPIIVEAHPVSFLFDPATGASTDLAMRDVWLPTVDSTGRFMTYWSGTVLTGPGDEGVRLGAGRLVLDGWLAPLASDRSPGPPATNPGSNPGSSPAGSPFVGPAGTPIELVAGPITAFDARFDPHGTRLAVWVADAGDPTVGTLRLVVLDHGNGRINPKLDPLPSVRALKGISMDEGRLAWVSPPGQDGDQSTVQVLAWSHDDFGQIETVPGGQLTIVR